jgi:thioredoxin reductase (NADPH)
VENYPGFAQGIQGPELMEIMKQQVERFGTEIKLATVTKVDFTKQPFTIWVGDNEFQSKAVIIATGASAKYLGLPSEQRLMGKGVSACATCDGFFYKGKEVVVIGGGDTAMEEATFLTHFATKVTVIHRRDSFRASKIMFDRVKQNPKITIITNKTIEEVLGDTAVTGVRIKDVQTGAVSDYPTQGFFLAIGHEPNTSFLRSHLTLDEKGYIVVENAPVLEAHTKTSVAGVFAAGDCVDPRYRQAVVAAGMGCMAAMDAEKWLETQGEHTISATAEMQWGAQVDTSLIPGK